jgi:CubicO group peptidase (beta-lactamase class C family)
MKTQPPPRPLDMLDPRMRPLCDAYLAAARIPGASVAAVRDDTAYHYAYGVKSVLTGEPVGASTSFNIGSCSKAFVSATIASLAAEGLVGWDDRVSDIVPEFQLYDPEVTRLLTLRDLCSNRLGLPRAGLIEFGLLPETTAEYTFANLRHTPPLHPFRDRFTYVNGGHAAAAVAAGRVTGKGFLPTLRERILDPLGMTGTSGGTAARAELSDLAAWHCVNDGEVVPIDTVFADHYLGSGGMCVSGADALQWLRLHLNGGSVDGVRVVPADALAETHAPHSIGRPGQEFSSLFYPGARMGAYALGWAASDFEGRRLVCHSGGDFGIQAMTVLLPDDGIGLAVYANARSSLGSLHAIFALAGLLIGLPPRDWKTYFDTHPAPPPKQTAGEPAEPPGDLSAYAGTYVHPADGPLIVERAGDGLSARFALGYRMDMTLRPEGGHRFAMAPVHPEWHGLFTAEPNSLTFALDAAGAAVSAEWRAGPKSRLFARSP